ncbi:MAG: SLATT domain-containing protein [Prolixibacteraceae bacterium]|nr:SLATT domain-containing protein [Prolixibacteraceae bacterium]
MDEKAYNLLVQIQELQCDSKIGKSRHFIAADRKSKNSKVVGLVVVLINVLIGSTFIKLIINNNYTTIFTSMLAFIAASLAAMQTFFNYSKDIENHRKIGNMYLEIARDADNLISKFNDKFIDKESCQNVFERLLAEYKKVNKEEEICPNSNKDYKKAYKKNKPSKDRIKSLKESINYRIDI